MPDRAAKSATTLDTATRLAFNRTRLAYDRTMMSWIRTSTALITFGFGIYKFFDLDLARGGPHHGLIGPRAFSFLMVATGLMALVMGTVEHFQNMRALRVEDPGTPRSRAIVIAALILLLGLLASVSIMFRL